MCEKGGGWVAHHYPGRFWWSNTTPICPRGFEWQNAVHDFSHWVAHIRELNVLKRKGKRDTEILDKQSVVDLAICGLNTGTLECLALKMRRGSFVCLIKATTTFRQAIQPIFSQKRSEQTKHPSAATGIEVDKDGLPVFTSIIGSRPRTCPVARAVDSIGD